jgi:hypothetical protein
MTKPPAQEVRDARALPGTLKGKRNARDESEDDEGPVQYLRQDRKIAEKERIARNNALLAKSWQRRPPAFTGSSLITGPSIGATDPATDPATGPSSAGVATDPATAPTASGPAVAGSSLTPVPTAIAESPSTPVPTIVPDSSISVQPVTVDAPLIPVPTSAVDSSNTTADSLTQGSDGVPEGDQDANSASRLPAAPITRAQDIDSNPSVLPAWLSDAADHLRAASHSPKWAELVDKFVAFEISIDSMVRLLLFV